MSEAEFDRLLDAVRTAIAPAPYEDFVITPPMSNPMPQPANDNQLAWGFVPFPEGWFASC